MHKKLAAWLSAHPWAAALMAAIFGALSPQGMSPFAVAAGAVPVLMSSRLSVERGFNAAIGGTVAVIALLMAAGETWLIAAVNAVGLYWAPFGLALLLRRTGSLNLCFQITVLSAGLAVGLVYAVLDDALGHWQALLDEAVTVMADAGVIEDRQAVMESLAASNWGTYVTLWLTTILGAVFLGRWWHSQLDAPGEFGREYRQLRLGKALGAIALAIVIGAMAFKRLEFSWPVVDAWMWIAVTALAFQGLAAAHRLKAAGSIGRGGLTAVYVLLIVPISTMLMVVLLAGWGLADNWRRAHTRDA